jgi:hypothetical protein
VMDLVPGAEPVRITPESTGDEWAILPAWSPDSKHILYYTATFERWSKDSIHTLNTAAEGTGSLCVVRDDGAELKSIYQPPKYTDSFRRASWSPSGNAVYVTVWGGTGFDKILDVPLDGSNVTEVVSGSLQDSPLPDDAQAQTDAAVQAAQEALHRCAVGDLHLFQGKLSEYREDYNAAAEMLKRLVWDYPLSGLNADDVLPYADICTSKASASDDDLLERSCYRRQVDLFRALWTSIDPRAFEVSRLTPEVDEWAQTYRQTLELPQTVGVLREWLQASKWDTEYLSPEEMLTCPGTKDHGPMPYIFQPPPPGVLPKKGDVVVRCPLHPQTTSVWNNWTSLGYLGSDYIKLWKNSEEILSQEVN